MKFPMTTDDGFSNSATTRRAFGRSIVAGAASALLARPSWSGPLERTLAITGATGRRLSADYVGFSYETAQLADPTFFAPDNRELIGLFHALSPRGVLRIGGNSSEFCWWRTRPDQPQPPDPSSAGNENNWMPHTMTAIEPAAIDNLAAFLAATGWSAIYGLNLGTGTPERAAEESAYVARALGPKLLYFQIGNEPEYYRDAHNGLRAPDWDFDKYLVQWSAMARAVLARVPEARFGGPDVGSNAQWVVRFAREVPQLFPGRIVAATGHYYAEGPPDDPRVTVARLLAPDPRVARDLTAVAAATDAAGIPYRMTEGNSCYRGGKPGMSNAFCSALWAADYMLQLAAYGCVGVNLHGGGTKQIRAALGGHLPGEALDPRAAEIAREGSFYTPIAGSRGLGFKARPILYGMKLAGLLAGGRMRTASLDGAAPGVSVYAADIGEGATRVVVINKDEESEVVIRIASSGGAKLWRLEAPGLTATAGVTFAGSAIESRGWEPGSEEHVESRDGAVRVAVKAASAVGVLFDRRLS